MQQIKQIYRSMKACVMAALLLCCAVSNAYAQNLVTPNNPDNYWYSSTASYPIIGMNTAGIAWGGAPTYNLFASVYYDQSGQEKLEGLDVYTTGAGIALLHSTPASVPDIAIGNVAGDQFHFIAAVAFVNVNGDPQIDFYQLYDDEYTTVTVNPTPVSSYTISAGTYKPHTVHIAVAADQTTTGPSGFPNCDAFAVVWDDYASSSTKNVFAGYGSMSAGTVSAIQQINPAGSVYGYAPDVAIVKRQVLVPPSTDYWALVTWVDGSGNDLYYSEWDVTTTPSSITPATLDNVSSGNGFSNPRIDAFQDMRYNATSEPWAVYKVVAQVDVPSGIYHFGAVRAYDNVLGAGSYYGASDIIDLSTIVPIGSPVAPYHDYMPTVALDVPVDYRIQHFLNYNATGDDVLFVEPMQISNSTGTDSNAYYWVNGGSGYTHIDAASCNYANAVCGSPNFQAGSFPLYAWAYNNAGSYDVEYKYPSWGSNYNFRPGTSSVTNLQEHAWAVYPNPANDALTVSNMEPGNSAYQLMDMAGQQLMSGPLGVKTAINVSSLAPGTYVIKLYRDGNDEGNALFVKE